MTSYIEIANLSRLAQAAVHELKFLGGQVPITRLGRPTGAHMVVAGPDASVTLPDAIGEARRLLAAFEGL